MADLRSVILTLNKPVVFKGSIREWKMLEWSEDEWSTLFGNEILPFRCGLKKCTPEPQWERTCSTSYETLSEFFKSRSDEDAGTWKYFDYKYLNQWLPSSDALKTMSWANLGFPEITCDECTLWIGSSGAHTPCHMDSYGCNLIAQLFGNKQWILFPPSEGSNLKMTRVPYEESSVYSSLNFNGPLGDVCDNLDNAYIITLSPGDVLFVPRHWWHYVENLSTAITINTWIPLPSDHDDRMDEFLVQFLVSQITSNLSPADALKILNPNEDDIGNMPLHIRMNHMQACIENFLEASSTGIDKTSILSEMKKDESEINKAKRRKVDSFKDSESFLFSFINKAFTEFKILEKCTSDELRTTLAAKCKCASEEKHKKISHSHDVTIKRLSNVINAFSHPEVLNLVKKHLTEREF